MGQVPMLIATAVASDEQLQQALQSAIACPSILHHALSTFWSSVHCAESPASHGALCGSDDFAGEAALHSALAASSVDKSFLPRHW